MGKDRETHQRDLYDAIERGDFPRWTLYVQIMNEEDANTYHIHPFDLTKVWPQADYPLIEVGVLELNRNPENFFADVEQARLPLLRRTSSRESASRRIGCFKDACSRTATRSATASASIII